MTSQAHTVSGMRPSVIPLARRSTVVVMKFSAPNSDAMQKIARPITHSVWPAPSPGPVICPERAQRRIRGPAGDGRATGDKKCRNQHHQRNERRPEGQHVEDRKGHVLGANLNRQHVIAEAGLRRRGQAP